MSGRRNILMKIIIASDSFKGCCSSLDIADAAERGIRKVFPRAEIVKFPVADGGEGTVDALVSGLGGEFRTLKITGPLGTEVSARYGILNRTTAVMEMAMASGLTLVPESERNPLITTTYGTGEMIKDALDCGCTKIVIGIGGSATNDGGAGMAQALGVSLTDKNGNELGYGGGNLHALEHIDMSKRDPRLSSCEITALCDVSNPLCGEQGASYIYGPQKGATPQDLPVLDANLRHYAGKIYAQIGVDILNISGAGAAGGLGAGLMAFCDAALKPGIATILKLVGLEDQLKDAQLVVTGEGRIDNQSAFGKVPVGVAAIAKRHNIPVIALVGSIGDGADAVYSRGVDSIMSITPGPVTLDQAIKNYAKYTADAAERMMRIFCLNSDSTISGQKCKQEERAHD